ncbi:hypothetical protein AX774_g5421 [Zancudomyces culisetae]|uniref:Uncharacterized protein n=1 Tax=Zancudomyces culisetae TaxID=1213189 RepID=A0A1R1PJN6_ZANCU|nr:hypothetical protein AX774_g5819 [Zancudomyces culisetae]OMH81133.1 hypothetical protein AX774_g5421 [Zancudomyces culisetae]|eukprot:OMH80739.1 hypothetical protein AX774_g5819 [Zancudomyces culisetae]
MNIDQVVQNGVNDIDVHLLTHLSKISAALAVAGEDDSVNFLVLSINDAEVKPLFSHKVPNVHFSSVQRLKFVSTDNQLLAISVATDQRVVLWRLAIHQSHMDVIKNYGTFNTIISDPSDMFLIKNTSEDSCCGVVVGIGLELFEFSKTLL